MSSSQNTSHDNEEHNSPDQVSLKEKENVTNLPEKDTQISIASYELITSSDAHENPLKSDGKVKNINNSPLNEGSVKIDETFLSNIEESLGGTEDIMSTEPNDDDDDDLELRYDDDPDNSDEIINEDALLEESVEPQDDFNKVQDEKNDMDIQNQDIPLEEDIIGKIVVLKDIKDSQVDQSNILGEAQKIEKECDKIDDPKDNLLKVEKGPENQKRETLVEEKNFCNQKPIYADIIAKDENKETDTNITDNDNTSMISQNSSFEKITEHGLNKPNMMLEIPTQEFIEFSDETDEELEETRLNMSTDIDEVIDLDDNLVNMDEENIEHVEDNVKSSVDVDMTIIADSRANTDTSQLIFQGHETCEDVNMDIVDSAQNDITTNALSHEAEIAADIITKEMNNVDVETFIKENDVIQEENENSIEELISSFDSEPDKEITNQLKETDDVIELSDDNIAIEVEDSESSSAESLPDVNVKIENSIRSAELEEDILNETEEIDNLILTSKKSKTKLTEADPKITNISSTKTCEKSISDQNTNINGSKPTNRIEISSQKFNKVNTETDKIVAMETSHKMPINTATEILHYVTPNELAKEEGIAQDISFQSVVSSNKIQITEAEIKASEECTPEKITTLNTSASSQSDGPSVSKIESKLPQESSSKLNMAVLTLVAHPENIDKQNSNSEEELQVSKTPKFTAEPVVSMDDPMSSISNIDMTVINECKHETELSSYALKSFSPKLEVLIEKPSSSVDNKEPVSNLEESMDVDGAEQLEPLIKVDGVEQFKPKIETEKSEIIEEPSMSKIEPKTKTCGQITTEKCELIPTEPSDKLPPSTLNLEQITSGTVEPTLSTPNIELITLKAVEPQESSLNINPKTSETREQTISEMVDPKPSISKIKSKTIETCESSPSTSKIEPMIAKTIDPNPFTSKIHLLIPEPVKPQAYSSNIGYKTSETVEPEPTTSKIELPPLESKEPQLSTSETVELQPITSKIEQPTSENIELSPSNLETVIPQPTTSKVEPLTSEIIEPQPSTSEKIEPQQTTSKVEPLKSEMIEPQPTTTIEPPKSEHTGIQPSTSETVEPQPPTSNIEPPTSESIELQLSTSETVEPQPTTSKFEPPTPESIELQPSTSETVEPQPTTSKVEPLKSEIIEPQLTTSTIEPPKSEHTGIQPSTSETVEPQPPTLESIELQPSTSETVEPQPKSTIEPPTLESIELQPSTSETIDLQPSTSVTIAPQPTTSKLEQPTSESIEPQPSTSKCNTEALHSKPNSPKNQSDFDSLIQDSSNEVPEMTDSLGLLAESSRPVMEDDEEHEDDDDDDGEDEDDFEPDDESSNQMTAEHSEDSNAHHSETDPKDPETLNDEKQEFQFKISESISVKEKGPEKMVCDEVKIKEIPESTEKSVNDGAVDENRPSNEIKTKQMEVETVKLSDTEDTEDAEKKEASGVLKALLLNKTPRTSTDSDYTAWTKKKKLSISKQESVVSYVDLEESSSDEDKNQPRTKASTVETEEPQDIATEDISSDLPQNEPTEVVKEPEKSSASSPKPVLEEGVVKLKEPQVAAKSKSPSQTDIPKSQSPETKAQSPIGLEVFNLDSDEEDSSIKQDIDSAAAEKPPTQQAKTRRLMKCINRFCDNTDPSAGYYVADTSTAMYFEADKTKRAYVCEKCANVVEKRNQELIEGMKNFRPLFQLHTARNSEELVEISDSDSDEEPQPTLDQLQIVGKNGAKMLEEHLANMLNETWAKYKMDDRLEETKKDLQKEMENLEKECQEIHAMFDECQVATDKLRNSLYATFDPDIQELPSIVIFDKPNCSYTCLEPPSNERRQNKRSLSPAERTPEAPPAKKPTTPTPAPAPAPPALPAQSMPEVVVETAPQDTEPKVEQMNMDISVVNLAVEAAPDDLPPPGDLSHPPIKLGMTVYAMKNAFGTWLRAKVVEIQPKTHNMAFTMVRVRFEHKVTKNPFKTLPARCLAYFEPSEVRMTIGTRVIALFKDISARQAYYSGIVAEIPNPVNKYRYLIFFDDGYAQYAPHSQTRLVCEFSSLVWEEVHPYSREFVRGYLLAYPERPMVRLHAGQNLKTEWRGKWWSSRVVSVDSSLVEVQFLRCDRREWIYRGSTRLAPLYLELQAAERHRPRALPRTQPQARTNMPYVEYTRSDEQANKQPQTPLQRQQQLHQQNEEIRRQRAVAKKSTALPQPPPPQPNNANLDGVNSRVVYYTPKNAVKPHKMTPHTCSPKCKRTDVLALKDLRTYNPLAKPLLSGWERQIVRFKGNKVVMYVAPCGRRLRSVRELHRYLRATDADMPVDLFDFSPTTHCLAEFVLNKCFVGKKDLSHGKEIVPVPCVNYYDDSLPEFCSYNTERTPTAGVPLNLDPEFLCGCDCEDDCEDKTKCACWQMTLEGARTIGYEGDVGYVYRRLPEPLPSGIYECNSRCKCKNTCLNRVAQHPLQLKLQVFKTLNRGWGIRALNDVPKGAFLCIYAGNLLTDATANLDGLNEGDEYLAELDYIEVVEQMKEGFEEDIPEKIKAKDKKELAKKPTEEDDSSSSSSSSEEETGINKNEREDGDFEPGFIGVGVAEFNKRLRRRDSKKEAEEAKQQVAKEANADDECITISDDEEVREPSCFTAAAGMGKNQFISKYRSVRTLFGEDEACYIMDAKVQGNIGRYLNHSCTPNVFVQNVFVDTHDPRFPWVAFFALHHIRAGTELTWNYNYDVGSVPGKVLYCFCGAPNCRGRLL
ncbi:uncharacterized protein LOC123870932 isoform X2 [Maniola jurtina]|uniref:uncharacterized protein LOC123870932 isoform X2 n=1 Tax=Maniola jurtina TaxID=191418 RepID=UPI001E68ABA1|nr:uncharacterized protein LOC123870932 isoform X2 [Maniola jurtina]